MVNASVKTDTIVKTEPPEQGFDTNTALAGLYLWLMFGYLSTLLSCNVQRLLTNNIYVKHFMAIICFFFLMTAIDKDNKLHPIAALKKTAIVYVVFMLSVKSRILPLYMIILLIDQIVLLYINYLENKKKTKDIEYWKKIRDYTFKGFIILSVLGFIDYGLIKYDKFGSSTDPNKTFSFITLFFGSNNCDMTKKDI